MVMEKFIQSGLKSSVCIGFSYAYL